MSMPQSYSPPPTDYIDEFARFVREAAVAGHSDDAPQSLKAWLDLAEAYRITQALRECRGNRSAAARVLGIGRRTLYAKMDKLGITATWRMS
ncbi:MAG TPA: helix-turn-helix domain-containing protein [Myxococcota bacterium]|nr:helix-turn-helix domain-containing protein [Myxococcota bacterium]